MLALAVGTALLVGWLWGDGSSRDWLLALGGSAEAFGLILVALPELESLAQRIAPTVLSGWRTLQALLRRVQGAVRRLLHRPQHHVIGAASSVMTAVGMRASGRVGIRQDATVDEKVDYLLRRDEKVQEKFEQVDIALEELPEHWQADIGEASEMLRREHTQALDRMRDRHINERLLGVGLLLAGIVLATAGNLA